MPSPQSPASTDASNTPEHWDRAYRARPSTQVSWYRLHLERSLAFIGDAAPDRGARILDVGGGASTLVDDLLVQGYRHLSVLDLSEEALRTARGRLGAAAHGVAWLHGDVRTVALEPQGIDLWHDRAVFHFLAGAADRAAYVRQAVQALKPGGGLVIATFAPDGPARCSGLPVVRYGAAGLAQVFGSAFRLEAQAADAHVTPGGSVQSFLYCRFVRMDCDLPPP